MQVVNRTQTVYNFKNTCQSCFNDIEFPLLGDFSEGEIIAQTKDGQDFCIVVLVDNSAFNFISKTLRNDKELTTNKVDPQNILIILADKINGKELTTDYPICPICRKRQSDFTDNVRTSTRELHFATWVIFENLTHDDKVSRIKEAARAILKKRTHNRRFSASLHSAGLADK